MAIAVVQSAAVLLGGLDSVSLTNPVASGNLVVVGLVTFNPPGVITSVNDSHGNIYLPIPGTDQADGMSGSSMWYCASVSGGPSAFQLVHTGDSFSGYVIEISGASSTPIDDSGGISSTGQPSGPNLTVSNPGDVLLAICGTDLSGNTGVNAPWSTLAGSSGFILADLFPGSTGMFQAIFTPTQTSNFASSGVAIKPPGGILTLTLMDSMTSGDSITEESDKVLTDSIILSDLLGVARARTVSDSMTMTDSFSLQSSATVPIPIPIVETLTNAEIPAEVKTFWKFE